MAAMLSLPSRGAWIEMSVPRVNCTLGRTSLPSRGAWIEIHFLALPDLVHRVAPLTGSVDRNKEVDSGLLKLSVAPLTGSVDRNKKLCRVSVTSDRSLPSRGAWIEIFRPAWRPERG